MPRTERSPEEIQREIATEREKLTAAFDGLGNAVDDAVNDLQRAVAQAGRKAVVFAPAVAAAVTGLLLTRRGRRRRQDRKARSATEAAVTSASNEALERDGG